MLLESALEELMTCVELVSAALCYGTVLLTSYFILTLDRRHTNPSYIRISCTVLGTTIGYLIIGAALTGLGSLGSFMLLPIAALRLPL